jgi:PEGA domain
MPPRKTPSALGQVEPMPDAPRAPAPRNRTLWAVLGAMMAVGALAAGVMAWQQWGEGTTTATPSAPTKDRSITKPAIATHTPTPPIGSGNGTGNGSGNGTGNGNGNGSGTGNGSGSGLATGSGSGSLPAPAPAPGPGSAVVKSPDRAVPDTVSIVSTPPGATVFLDGAEQGKTPLTLPTARDKHTIAVVKSGFDLYLKEMAGGGAVQATLTEVTPTGGPAGIKVKCKTKDRYYVIVDGAGTGQVCPTERINVPLGPHTVEVYDLVTEQRTQYPVVVKDTEHSLRVKLD